jgi:glycosyltransferase involved in cell wall biosynthesis
MSEPALVSLLIPAYNARHFGEAFASALSQRYSPLEIVVCDDSQGAAIGETVRAAHDPRVRYVRNPGRLGFSANFSRCLGEARGDLVKFLNDDDRLRPYCVETLAGALTNPGIVLGTSRRQVIDDTGRAVADVPASTPISHVTALFGGRDLGNFVLGNAMNLVGEPTTVLFRRSLLELDAGNVFRWDGRDYHCLADVSVWLRLLSKGLAYYAASPLSEFRVHPAQEQRKQEVRLACLTEWLGLYRSAIARGFLSTTSLRLTALKTLAARARAWREGPALDGATLQSLAEFERELELENAALAEPARRENN